MEQGSEHGMATLGIWTAAMGLVCLGLCAVALWVLVRHVRELVRHSRALSRLESLESALQRLANERSDLDLRRIEHLLVDLRDSLKRTEQAALQQLETQALALGAATPERASAQTLGERITNRLHAMGYEQVWISTPVEEWAALLEAPEGTVAVEARRAGVQHKGRVHVCRGHIGALELHSPYALFP